MDTMGAIAARGDVLNRDAMRRLMIEHKPDSVVNLATSIPLKLKIHPHEWEMNDKVRTDGTANLLAAALDVRAHLFVQESVGYVCLPLGPGWIDEESPVTDHPFLQGTLKMEQLIRESAVPTTLLLFGALTSADSWHTQQSITALRRGMLPVVGDGSAYMSLIHTHDAAQAIVRALANPGAAQDKTFNVVDDAPATMDEVFPFAAQQLSAPKPKHVAPLVAKIAVGGLTVDLLLASYRMSNARIKEVLKFAPRYPTYRETWAQIAQEVGSRDIAHHKRA